MTKRKSALAGAAAAAAGIESPSIRSEGQPRSAKFVTVASKLPMSIIIQLCRPQTKTVSGQYGPVNETVHAPYGETYVIRGNAQPNGTRPKGFPKAPEILDSGFALTSKIPADFFAEWMSQNADADMVRNNLIFAHGDRDHVDGIAEDHADVLSNLEPLNPDGDPRAPRPMFAELEPIKTVSDRKVA